MLPLLRTPPFPWIAPARAAVSGGASIGTVGIDFAAIRAARVGGAFWGPRPSLDGVTAVVAPRTRADLPDLIAALDAPARTKPLVLAGDDIDPWPLLDSPLPIVAHADHDLAGLAHVSGRACTIVGAGRYATPDSTAQALAETVYRDPYTGGRATLTETVERLALWRRTIDVNRGIAVACGMAWWKRTEIERFLWAPRDRPLRFVRSARRAVRLAARSGGGIAVWPSKISPTLQRRAAARGVPIVRVEDGFIRSIGLGSDLFPPLSVVADARGIYYDPSRPSDLEHILATADFPPALVARAEALSAAVIAAGISKYAAGAIAHAFPERDPARRLILVPGQVENDLSVAAGGGDVQGNLDLLRRVRAAAPDAEIWYRPHPDVDAGHRPGKVADADALGAADRVVRGGTVSALLDLVDEVHTLTSLMGFEALLRGRKVTAYGAPFYAGWGLTTDAGAVPDRRGPSLSVAELAAGTLILYPRYLDPVTGLIAPPEQLVARFRENVRPRRTLLHRLRRLQGRLIAPWRG